VKVRTFVALGDSFTEGLDDPYGDGRFRGWADRVAERLALVEPEFRYANLAIRGRLVSQIVAEQVPAALRLEPDLVSLAGGGNDLLRGVEPARLEALIVEAVRQLRETGSQVLLVLGADASRLPWGRRLTPRIHALNEVVRRISAEFGTLLAAPGGPETFAERRFWSPDRLHLSADGHQVVADGVLTILGVEASAPSATEAARLREVIPLAPVLSQSWAAERLDDLRWARDYGLPWVGRRLRGRSSGDGLLPKRPDLTPFGLEGGAGPGS
jgi:lysophospholipase L1-like esterase